MEASEIYRSLGDDSRLRILAILDQGQFNVQELTSILDLSQPTVSHHLKVLQGAGLIRVRREGTWGYYGLVSENESVPYRISRNFLDLASGPINGEFGKVLKSDSRAASRTLEKRREEARKFFDSVAHEWKDLRSGANGHANYLDFLMEQIPKEGTLLELGCGSGALLERVLPRKGTTIGVDYSQAMLEEAHKNLADCEDGLDLRLGYLEHLPLADNSVDLAVAYMVIHHIATPVDVFKDVFRVLRPGGSVAIIDLVSHKNENMRERYADLWLGFEPGEFASWFSQCGFKQINHKVLGASKEAFMITAVKPK